MPKARCPNCGYTRKMSERELEIGMRCPQCEGRNLRLVVPKKRTGWPGGIRATSIRALIGGVLLLFLGWGLVSWGRAHWNDGMAGARFFAWGIVMLGFGAISLIGGVCSFVYDLFT